MQPARHTTITIEPILQHFHTLGNNSNMSVADRTTKLCWLLGICDFMRPADIEHVDLDQFTFHDPTKNATLQVYGPKERRHGHRITRTVVLNPHPVHNVWKLLEGLFGTTMNKASSEIHKLH